MCVSVHRRKVGLHTVYLLQNIYSVTGNVSTARDLQQALGTQCHYMHCIKAQEPTTHQEKRNKEK